MAFVSRSKLRCLRLGAGLLLVVCIAGCGRKGALDPPPNSISQAAPATAQPGVPDNPQAPPAENNKQLPIDWLLR
jgi:predicted small lipoprotein YifL